MKLFDCKACSQKSSWECISRNLHCCTFIIFTLSLPVNATQGSQRTGLLITRSTAKPSNIGGGGTSAQWLLGDMMRQSGARYMTTSEDEASGLMVTNPTVTVPTCGKVATAQKLPQKTERGLRISPESRSISGIQEQRDLRSA